MVGATLLHAFGISVEAIQVVCANTQIPRQRANLTEWVPYRNDRRVFTAAAMLLMRLIFGLREKQRLDIIGKRRAPAVLCAVGSCLCCCRPRVLPFVGPE